ncbi:MAG TPA: tetratricopeptide repeat-containing sensor histidine kinase [Chitinophagaceae bacterium]|nr:tetratricopeptide repeat-containing sensor histidine kinase [Chitinophagaceae bacterium]
MKRFSSIVLPVIVAVCLCVFFACNLNRRHTPPAAFFQKALDSVAALGSYVTSAYPYLDSIFAEYPGADPTARFHYYGMYCGYYHTKIGDEKKTLLYADSMLWIIHKNPSMPDYDKNDAIANISKGDALFGLKQYNEAYQYYYLGKVAAEKSIDPCTFSEYSYRLGMVMYKKSSFAEAASYFKQAFNESKACPESYTEFYRRQELLNNTALSYKKSGQSDSALLYYSKALDFIALNEKIYKGSSGPFDLARGVVYGNMGQVYAPYDRANAELLYKKSIAINSRPGYDNNDALITQLHLANLYKDSNDYSLMYHVLQDMQKGLDTIKNDGVKMGWSELMWKYFDSKNDIATAYTYLKEYNRLKDSEDAANKKLNESDVTGEMKSLEAEYQVNLLKKDSKLNQLYFLVAAAFVVSLAIILMLILYNWRKSRRNVRTLTLLNDRINKQKEQLEDTLGELQERNNEKDRILGIVAHDLRNPIAAISSLISILEDENDYSGEQLQILELMQNACTNSIELINEILDFAINDGNSVDLSPEPVDMNIIARNCVRLLSFKAAEKKQKLQLSLSESQEIIKANPAKMWRVLSNLITNAVKFSPSGGIIQIVTEHIEGYVQLSVHDMGIGIPDNLKNKIFDTHTEAKRPGTQGEKPFGLGLSICKQIVESYNGKIWFETTVGKGTIFYISMPRQHNTVQTEDHQKNPA